MIYKVRLWKGETTTEPLGSYYTDDINSSERYPTKYQFGGLQIETDGWRTRIYTLADTDFVVVINGSDYDIELEDYQSGTGTVLVGDNEPQEDLIWDILK